MKNYFASFIPAVKAILGIEAWSKDADKKDALLEEQKQKLKALNFNDTFINGFCEALKDGSRRILPARTGSRARKAVVLTPIPPTQ